MPVFASVFITSAFALTALLLSQHLTFNVVPSSIQEAKAIEQKDSSQGATSNTIDFSRNMYNSIARNNIVYNEIQSIFVSQSHNNQIYNNTISTSGDGIYVNSGSTNNRMYDNTIMDSKSHAILLKNASSANTFYSNKIVSSKSQGLKINQDSTSKNTFSNNQIGSSGAASTTTSTELSKEDNTIKHPSNKKPSTK